MNGLTEGLCQMCKLEQSDFCDVERGDTRHVGQTRIIGHQWHDAVRDLWVGSRKGNVRSPDC